MLEIKDIEKLAKLARIELTEAEKETYLKDLGDILQYVDQIKEVVAEVGEDRSISTVRNVLRADTVKNKAGEQTESIVAGFPVSQKNYLQVKKILG